MSCGVLVFPYLGWLLKPLAGFDLGSVGLEAAQSLGPPISRGIEPEHHSASSGKGSGVGQQECSGRGGVLLGMGAETAAIRSTTGLVTQRLQVGRLAPADRA